MIRNNLSWINLNAGSSGGSGGGGVSDYNDLANRPIISMTGTSQNPLKLWNLSTGLYLLNGYVYYNTTNTRECVNLFVSITAQIQNGKYVLSAFVPSWEGHYEYIKANSTSTDYTDTQILKMLTEDDVLTLTNEVEYTPTTDYHPSTKKYVDEAMQSVMEEFAKMGVNEQDIKTLIAENRRRDIAIQALLNETADKNVTIEEDTHTISLDYSMEDGMATVNSIEGSTLVNVSKTVDEVYVTKSQDRVEQTKVANTVGEQNGKICPIIEGDTLVNVCDQKDPIAITKSYTVENSGNHVALQGEYDGKCRPVIQGNTLVNLVKELYTTTVNGGGHNIINATNKGFSLVKGNAIEYVVYNLPYDLKVGTTYTLVYDIISNTLTDTNPNFGIYVDGVFGCFQSKTTTGGSCDGLLGRVVSTHIITEGRDYFNRLSIGIHTATPGGELVVDNIMLFEGDLTQTPELIPTEYVEGLKSSFEDNLVTQAMVDSGEESAENLGKYKVEYKVTGKNKFDGELEIGSINDLAGTLISETNCLRSKNFNIINPNLIYTWSNDLNYITIRYFYDENYKFIKTGNFNDIPNNVKYFKFRTSVNNIENNLSVKFQLEEGTVVTEYEPYKEYTKTFYLNSPLLEGDTIEDVNGVATHVHRYGMVVLDGSEDEVWRNYSGSDEYFNGFVDTTNIKYDNSSNMICDTFVSAPFYGWCDMENVGVGGSPHIQFFISRDKLDTQDISGVRKWFSKNPTTVVYELASPIYEPISTESILCDSYVNGHLDFDSVVPVKKVEFMHPGAFDLKYLQPNSNYIIQFESDNVGIVNYIDIGGDWVNNGKTSSKTNHSIVKGMNRFYVNTPGKYNDIYWNGIGFNASNIVVTEATDKDFDCFNGIQSTFEENLVTDENNPHYGKYRVIYRTKSSDGNASTVKSVYLNSPLLQGDKLVVVNGKLCHYHKMGMIVLDGSENYIIFNGTVNNDMIVPYINLSSSKPYEKNFLCNNFITITTKDTSAKLGKEECIFIGENTMNGKSIGALFISIKKDKISNDINAYFQQNPTTVVYELANPYYEEISSNPKDTVVDFYANGTLEVQSAVYPLSMKFTSFEEELTYLYASTVYTVQFEANGNAIANITLGGTTVTNQEITHGLNKIQVTTPSTLVDNKLIIDGCGDCKISKVVVTNSTEEFDYFEGMKSAFEDKQNEDGTYTVEIVVYNAPIRLNKDKE